MFCLSLLHLMESMSFSLSLTIVAFRLTDELIVKHFGSFSITLNFGEYLYIGAPSGIVSSNLVRLSRDIWASNLRNLSSVMKVYIFFCFSLILFFALAIFPIKARFLISKSSRSSLVGSLTGTYSSSCPEMV